MPILWSCQISKDEVIEGIGKHMTTYICNKIINGIVLVFIIFYHSIQGKLIV
jgi:hypothetical protein